MLVEVIKTMRMRETVEIELPYFYKHDLMMDECDSIIYGKIGEREHYSIQVTYHRDHADVKVERERTDWQHCSCYLGEEYKSNADEYAEAKALAIAAIQAA